LARSLDAFSGQARTPPKRASRTGRHEQDAGGTGNLTDAGDADPPPPFVEEVEQSLRLSQVGRVEPEVVHLRGSFLHPENGETLAEILVRSQNVEPSHASAHLIPDLASPSARVERWARSREEALLDLLPECRHRLL
jgi:hypothetical protein